MAGSIPGYWAVFRKWTLTYLKKKLGEERLLQDPFQQAPRLQGTINDLFLSIFPTKQREEDVKNEQLEAIFKLMEEQKQKFGEMSKDEIKEQMRLYVQ